MRPETNLISNAGHPDFTGGLWPPCAPDDLSNNRFFNALNGPSWFINNTQYGHADLYQPRVVGMNNVSGMNACFSGGSINASTFQAISFCPTHDPPEPEPLYRKYLAGQIISFMKGKVLLC